MINFLKRIITVNEKCVVYNKVKRERSWSKKDEPAQTISKVDIPPKTWCSRIGDILKDSFFLPFPDNTTINLDVYYQQLDKLNDVIQQKSQN